MAYRWTLAWSARQAVRLSRAGTLLMGLVAGVPALAAAVQSVRIDNDRIVIRFDGTVADATSSAVRSATGSRLQMAVDVLGAEPGGHAAAAGPVTAIRQDGRAGGLRLTFDLSRPVLVDDGSFDAAGRVLTLMLHEATEARFAAASVATPSSFFPINLSGWRRPRYKVSVAVPPAARAAPLPRVEGDDRRPLVVIDPGHGGIDPGAIGRESGLREKDVTLRIAKAIRAELLASGRVRVALTRDDDRYLVLRERYGIARRLKADLFISIHCDSVATEPGSLGATGASVYTLSEVASDKEAARLAARENKADVIGGVDLAGAGADVRSILIDLTQRETMNASAGFARLLAREAKPLIPTKPAFHQMASLMVLKAPDMPSILFETGYISNPTDAAFLNSDDGRDRLARSVTRAVEVHFARRIATR